MKSSFIIFPVFQLRQKLFPPQGGGGEWPEYISLVRRVSLDSWPWPLSRRRTPLSTTCSLEEPREDNVNFWCLNGSTTFLARAGSTFSKSGSEKPGSALPKCGSQDSDPYPRQNGWIRNAVVFWHSLSFFNDNDNKRAFCPSVMDVLVELSIVFSLSHPSSRLPSLPYSFTSYQQPTKP